MRCMACGAQMHLMQTVADDTMPVPGFEHQTFMCSECYDVERRLVFNRHDETGESVPVHSGRVIAPAAARQQHIATDDSEPMVARGMFRRVLSRLRGG